MNTWQLIKEFGVHIKGPVKWFLLLTIFIIVTDIAFSLMNSASTIAFVIGCAIIVLEISLIIFIINKYKQVK